MRLFVNPPGGWLTLAAGTIKDYGFVPGGVIGEVVVGVVAG
jgi:hypothetical protein